MQILIWAGAGLAGLGLVGVLISLLMAYRLKSSPLSAAENAPRFRTVYLINALAMGVFFLGFMVSILGIFL